MKSAISSCGVTLNRVKKSKTEPFSALFHLSLQKKTFNGGKYKVSLYSLRSVLRSVFIHANNILTQTKVEQ